MRAAKGLPSFRAEVVQRLLKEALVRQAHRDYGSAFQIVHFSIQTDHLHLVAEAKAAEPAAVARSPRLVSKRAKLGLETKERDMLRRGIAGFAISFARQLNKLLKRKGKVWGDRHHRRDLVTPTEVRNTLLYVFQNVRRHGARAFGPALDAYSTAMTFGGWSERTAPSDETEPWRPPPRTWLLSRGWLRGGGPLSPYHGPPLSPHARVAPAARAYRPYKIERNVSDARLRELGLID
jgi:REP element-mobilizing transposase RayT